MKSFRHLVVLAFAAAFAVTARAVDDLVAMRGTWKPTAAVLGGTAMPSPVLKSITLKMDGGNYEVIVVTERGPSPDKGTVVLDAAASPKGMIVKGVEGPNAGKVLPAIYEIDGDTMRICYDLSGKKRPTEFASTPQTLLYLVTYRREK